MFLSINDILDLSLIHIDVYKRQPLRGMVHKYLGTLCRVYDWMLLVSLPPPSVRYYTLLVGKCDMIVLPVELFLLMLLIYTCSSRALITLRAVSYTHLDVYKRQDNLRKTSSLV